MQLKKFDHLQSFIPLATPYWQANPVTSNLQWALSLRYAMQNQTSMSFVLLDEMGRPTHYGLQTEASRPLILTGGQINAEQVNLLENTFAGFPALIAERALAHAYLEHTQWKNHIGAWLHIYRLAELSDRAPQNVQGFRRAVLTDIDILTVWIEDFLIFIEEIGGSTDYRGRAKDLIEKGQLYVLTVGGKLVSMAGSTRSVGGVAVINNVYTPPAMRGKGYSSACVGELTRLLLLNHDYCCLYADQDYPPSNGVYLKLGYEVIGASAEILFD